MPELPDIAAYLTALDGRIVGQTLLRVRLKSPFVLRTVHPAPASTEGRRVVELRRLGKRIAIGLEEELWLVLHLMIAGRLHWREPQAKLGGRNQLAAFDFNGGSLVLTEAGTTNRSSLHVYAGEDALRAADPAGIDPLHTDLSAFRQAFRRENRTLKRALTDPRIVSGIGDEWKRLHAGTRETLEVWIDRLQNEARDRFPEKVTAFRPEMAVHGRFGKPCPVCGAPVQRISYAGKETNYCPGCQTGGRVLMDRSLSRLLGTDWPRTLEELETLGRTTTPG